MATFEYHTFIRRRSSYFFTRGPQIFCTMGPNQPLILIPEPTNPVHAGAVICADLIGRQFGYLAREDAGIISAMIRNGFSLLARMDGPCLCGDRDVYIWSEGLEETEEESVNETEPVS